MGYGADGACPWVAYGAFARMNAEGLVRAKAGVELGDEQVCFYARFFLSL